MTASTRSRTPHLDRAMQRRAEVKRVTTWKRKNFARRKLAIINAQDDTEKRQAATAVFLAGHTHKCMRCPRTYTCTNACSPDGDDSKNSICEPCFMEVQCA